uniref:glycosyltransferase family 2 protein n=1 Tax=Thaumasiovibrio occultus TaxID=1891184 RepID=UPI00131DA3F1
MTSREIVFSVIIPVYNGEDFIRRCLDSIVSQSCSVEYEVIVVDDASTDNTAVLLSKYASEFDGYVQVVTHEENKRQGGARNTGLDIARGKYILFLDADDWLELDALNT